MKKALDYWRLLAVFTASILLAPADAVALAPDPAFHAPRFMTPSTASGVLPLPDGKFLRFFNTNSLADQPTGPITRHFADGSLDSSFQFSSNYYHVSAALSLPDGKIIVSALRTAYGVFNTEEMLRLKPDGSIDPSFGPVLVSANGLGAVRGLVLQPDGKIIVSGQFTDWAGDTARPGIVRLTADGLLDSAFASVPLFATGTAPGTLTLDDPILQPDGKIVIYGNFRRITYSNGSGLSYPTGIARLNGDGTLDYSFQPSGFTRATYARTGALQSDGKIVIGGKFSVTASFAANPTGATYANLPYVRLNPNGSVDQSYGYFDASAPFFLMRDTVIQSDGKVVGTTITSGQARILRFSANGALDTSFHQPAFQDANPAAIDPFPTAYRLYLLADGRFLTGGTFTDVDQAVPNESNFGVARLNPDGTLDTRLRTNTKTAFVTWPTQVSLGGNAKTLISFGGEFSVSADTPVPNDFARVDADGKLDSSYRPFADPPSTALLQNDFTDAGFARLADDKVLLFGNQAGYGEFQYGKLLSEGTQDPGFNVDPAVIALFGTHDGYILGRGVHGLLQPGYGVLLGATDAQGVVDGSALARIATNGALDPSFQFPTSLSDALVIRDGSGFIDSIYADTGLLAVQPDGKVLFVYLNNDLSGRLVRLNQNGSLDPTFSPVQALPLTTGLDFPTVYDPQTGITLQPPNGVYRGKSIQDVEVQSDGRIMVVGPFMSINGTQSRGIARLNADGTIDSSFQTAQGPSWNSLTETTTLRPIIEQVESDADGKLLIAGTFEAFDGVPAPGIVRLNPDGSVDTSFTAPAVRNKYYADSSSTVLARQTDGSFFLSGPYSYPNDSIVPALLHILLAPSLSSAVSRMTHGSAGDFDLNLPLTGTAGVECRSGAAGRNFKIVFTFNNNLQSGSASITSGTGSVTDATVAGKTLTLNLSGVANAQKLNVILHAVTDAASQVLPDTPVSIGFLLGDSNGDGFVNGGDAIQTRSRSGQTSDVTNFRSDVNADGMINGGDTIAVRAHSGTSLP